MKRKSWITRLQKKSERKGPAGSTGTIAFYGPDNSYASKVAVGIVPRAGGEVTELERWFEDGLDVRIDPRIGQEVTKFLSARGVRAVTVAEGIIGCPHEEGVDYPKGEECPQCPFWKGKDRFEHAVRD